MPRAECKYSGFPVLISNPWFKSSYLEIDLFGHKRVDAALHFIEAGPPSGAFILTAIRLARAGLAPDGPITQVLQRIVGDLMLTQVVPYRIPRPIRHGI